VQGDAPAIAMFGAAPRAKPVKEKSSAAGCLLLMASWHMGLP
jgi:hypothetical protein